MRSRWWAAHRTLLYLLILVTAGIATYGLTVTVRGPHRALQSATSPPPPPAPSPATSPAFPLPAAASAALGSPAPPASGRSAAQPDPDAVARALAGPVAATALGARLLAHVIDAQTGTVLYDRSGSTPAAPASTAKLMTASAILTVRSPTDRFRTEVVAGKEKGTIVLVGGGDPTLTGAAAGRPGAYPDAARLSDLAAHLRAAHVPVSRIVVDSSLFAGPAISPDWAPEDVPSSYGAAITALMTDGGRALPTDGIRSSSSDLAAGAAFAARLGHPDLPVTRGTAPSGAQALASVESAPLVTLVDQMLQDSDNVIAEVLSRQVAVARHEAASFRGGAAAISDVLAGLGVQVGDGMRDGSGLSAADRVSPTALTAVLRLITGASGGAASAGARYVFAAMPVGGWSGTLAGRYGSAPAATAAGRVRAKTGTLTGVSTLAGAVRDDTGRLIIFSLDADRAPPGGSYGADAALDVVAATLAACGCR